MMGLDYLKIHTEGSMGRNVVRNLEKGKVTPPPHASPVVLTDGTAVCNCPRGGNEAMQIEAENLW